MAKIVADISMSLDGFVTGPDPDLEHGLGRGGEPLHAWVTDNPDSLEKDILAEAVEATGALVMGRRLFDFVDGPHGWSEEMGYGAGHAATPPVFVVTHERPGGARLGPRFRFVTGGIESAITAARDAAGGRDVFVMGGGDVVRQAVELGLADELRIHLAPLILGSGTPLFAGGGPPFYGTHLTYDVVP